MPCRGHRNKIYKTKRHVEEAMRIGAAEVIQRNWREFKVLQRARTDEIGRRKAAAGDLEHTMIKDVAGRYHSLCVLFCLTHRSSDARKSPDDSKRSSLVTQK